MEETEEVRGSGQGREGDVIPQYSNRTLCYQLTSCVKTLVSPVSIISSSFSSLTSRPAAPMTDKPVLLYTNTGVHVISYGYGLVAILTVF